MILRRSFSGIAVLFILLASWTIALAQQPPEYDSGKNVEKLGHIDFDAMPYSDIYYHNGLAYIGTYESGQVYIVDVRDEKNVHHLGTYRASISAGILDLQVRGNYLFCALAAEGFTIVDISDPAKPKEIAFYRENLPRGVHDLFVTDKYIYLCDNDFNNSRLHIVDISKITSPKFVTTFKSNGGTHDLTIVGNTAYIANLRGGFRIADFSDPANPKALVDHNYANSFTHNIWPSEDGKYVFTTDEICGNGHLRAFDISELSNIRQVGEYSASGEPEAVIHNVMVVGQYAYISYYRHGLRIVDISDPTKMKEVASYNTWDGRAFGTVCFEGAWGVFAEPTGKVYISDISTGIWAFQFSALRDEPPTAQITSPKGGEVFGQNQSIQINWNAHDDQGISAQSLELSLDGGKNYTSIASQLSGDIRSLNFKLPAITTAQGKLRLTVIDSKNQSVTAESEQFFEIVTDAPPTIKVTYPNGGEVFRPGESINLQWQSSDDRALVSQSIELSINGGNSYTTVANLNGALQQFTLQLPTTLTSQALIRINVNDGNNPAVADASDQTFAISDDMPPTVQLLSPIGGEQFITGEQIQVSWQSKDDRGLQSQSIEFSTNSGATYVELARVDGNVQSFSVKLPLVASLVCRIRITVDDGKNQPVSSVSSKDFGLFEAIPKISTLSLKSQSPDRLIIDLDPDSVHHHSLISPKHEGEGVLSPKVEIDSGNGFIGYLETGKSSRDETRFVTKGKLINGQTTRQTLPNGVAATIRYTDDHGAHTDIRVVRNGNSFKVVQ